MFQPHDTDDLVAFLKLVPEEVPVMVVGVGSNLLVRDGGIPGVVIRLSAKGFGDLELAGENRIKAGAICPDKNIAAMALDHGIGGFYFYYGIPGSIGGALRMNAGANSGETSERVIEVHAVDRKGNRHVLSKAEMGYGYRHSGAAKELIFTHAIFEGYAEDKTKIRTDMDAVRQHRETVQPIREKTGGSTFKNPDGHSAWKLIDEAGCRGMMIGNAQMSPLHCNFMINTGQATGYELEYLGETVRQRVMEHSGVSWMGNQAGRQFHAGLRNQGIPRPRHGLSRNQDQRKGPRRSSAAALFSGLFHLSPRPLPRSKEAGRRA